MKIAIIDSGVHPAHPHVGGVAGGVGVTPQELTADFVDRLGHGTAVAGAIREKVGLDASLYAVRVFDQRLTANIDVILRALQWCAEQRMDLINLSLGTSNPAHREKFEHALADGPLVVGAAGSLPGDLPGVIGVAPDTECPRDSYRYRDGIFYASPFPRPIPGVPEQYNLNGASFAVANMTGLIARFLIETAESGFGPAAHERIHRALAARATTAPIVASSLDPPR
jgi:hypothetical protein